jgi:hypothetical protein
MKRIADIAEIRLGTSFRERVLHEPAGKFLVVQGKDVGADGSLVLDGMARVSNVPGKGAPDILSGGELVFQTRGVSYRAASVPDAAPPMVAAGSLFILRPDTSRLVADYLVFFLNLHTTQALLRQLATGSTIPNLRRAAIEQLEVPLPSLADQQKLVAVGRLVRQQADIEARLNHLRMQELHLLATARAEHTSSGDGKRAPAHAKSSTLQSLSDNNRSSP